MMLQMVSYFHPSAQQAVPVPVRTVGDSAQAPQGHAGDTQQFGRPQLRFHAGFILIPQEVPAAVLRGVDGVGLLVGLGPALDGVSLGQPLGRRLHGHVHRRSGDQIAVLIDLPGDVPGAEGQDHLFRLHPLDHVPQVQINTAQGHRGAMFVIGAALVVFQGSGIVVVSHEDHLIRQSADALIIIGVPINAAVRWHRLYADIQGQRAVREILQLDGELAQERDEVLSAAASWARVAVRLGPKAMSVIPLVIPMV